MKLTSTHVNRSLTFDEFCLWVSTLDEVHQVKKIEEGHFSLCFDDGLQISYKYDFLRKCDEAGGIDKRHIVTAFRDVSSSEMRSFGRNYAYELLQSIFESARGINFLDD